jgi:hypothetical protein
MGELINFTALDDLLEFRDAGQAKVEELLDRMISVVRRMQSHPTASAHDELVALQLERAHAVGRLELMNDMTKVVGSNRSSLLNFMGKTCGSTIIVVGNDDLSKSVGLVAKREKAKIVCMDIELVEADASGQLKPFWGDRKPLVIPQCFEAQ